MRMRQAGRTCQMTLVRDGLEIRVTVWGYPLGDEDEDGYEFDHASDATGQTIPLTDEEASDAENLLNY